MRVAIAAGAVVLAAVVHLEQTHVELLLIQVQVALLEHAQDGVHLIRIIVQVVQRALKAADLGIGLHPREGDVGVAAPVHIQNVAQQVLMDLEVALGALLVVDHLGRDEQLLDAALLHLIVRDERVELGRGLIKFVILAPEGVDGRDGRHMDGFVGERIVRLPALDRPAGVRNALAAVPAQLCRHVVVDDLRAVDAGAQRPLDLAGDRVLAHEALGRDDLAPCALGRAVDDRLIGLEVVMRVPELAALLHDGQAGELRQTLGQIADDFAFFCSDHNRFSFAI